MNSIIIQTMKKLLTLSLTLVVTITFAEISAAQSSGLVSWWPGDGNANDIQDGNDGTLINGTTFAPGKVGQAFSFDGVDDEISILKMSNLNMGASDFSIEAWVNVAQTQTPQGMIFFNYAGVPAYLLWITPEAKANVAFRPSVPSLSGSVNDPSVGATGTTSLNDGQWHHLVGVRSGATTLIYVDGVLEGSATNPEVLTVNGGSVDTGSCLYARIGAVHSDTGHCYSPTANLLEDQFFQGLIDEVKIYNRALTASEIQAIFDTIPPETSITSALDGNGAAVSSGGSTLSNSITFTFGGTDAVGVAGFQCSLDGSAYVPCSSPVSYSALAIGSHIFKVRSIDAAGNVDPSPSSFTWTVVTPAEDIQNLITTIDNMGLPAGVANSLTAPLVQAFNLLKDNNPNNDIAVCGKMNAFINQVNAKVQNGQLTPAQASQLLQSANAIIASLGC